MVFEGENKVLEEDILKRRGGFVKTWTEHAADEFEQVIASRLGSTAASQVIFTVPQAHTLFITNAFISIHGTVSDNRCNIRLGTRSLIGVVAGNHDNQELAQAYPMPIKAEAGQVIEYNNIVGNTVIFQAGIIGFLVPKKIT